MLYSILVGFIVYYVILFAIGFLVNSIAIEGSLVAFATVCFVGAYFARQSRFVRRLANGFGFTSVTLLVAQWILLPMLQGHKNVLIDIAIMFAIIIYIFSRRYWHKRFLKRNQRPAPPFGKEWARWLFAFIA